MVSAGTELRYCLFFLFLVAKVVLCFGLRKNADSILMFQLLLRNRGLFNFTCLASMQVHQKLGGSMARAMDTNWPVEYCISCNVMPCI